MVKPNGKSARGGILDQIRSFSAGSAGKAQSLRQLLVFWLMGGVAGVIDLVVFALCNYFVFTAFRDMGVRFWLFDYSVANGGLCAFLSFAVSFAVSQTANFFIQRKATFGATGNVLRSGIEYAVLVIAVYILILWLPTVIGTPVYAALGSGLGAIAVKLISQFVSFLIQFPVNKFVIMRSDTPKGNA